MSPRFHLTRIAALIVAGAAITRLDDATLQDHVRYAVSACRVTNPLTGESWTSFDLQNPPPDPTSGVVALRLAAEVLR